MIDASSARIRADGVSRATVSAGTRADPRSVPATTPRSIDVVPRSWHSGTSLSSHYGTSPRDKPRSSLVPVRRPVPAQALLVVRFGRLAPADAGFVLAPLRQHRLVVRVRLHDPIIARRSWSRHRPGPADAR